MNIDKFPSRVVTIVTFVFCLCAAGCKHEPTVKKSSMPVTDVQAPITKPVLRPLVEPREKELQNQIDTMQEQVRTLTARTEAMAAFHAIRMGPKWVEKVKAAREEGSRPAERLRYLEAMKKLLARKLEALRDEMKVYEDFQASDPSIPRP
jgi:hypothetical protein